MENLKEFIAEKKYLFITGILTLMCIFMGFLYLKKADAEEAFNCPVVEEEEIETLGEYVSVDIKGAIRNPGVYNLKEGSVVNDLIKAAGGLMADADTSTLNLSKKLSDEMVIVVYTKAEVKEQNQTSLGDASITNELESNETIIGGTTKEKQESNGKINLNTASQEELETLPGIKTVKAQSIIAYRQKCGAFRKIEDIKNISGVGDKLYEQIKDYITV